MGYLENINSDRQLMDHCAMRLDIRYFLDYDIDEDLPWHSTLSRTRQLFGQQIFTAVFNKVLALCVDKGMVSGKRQAIDSALIKANASMDSLVKKQILEDGSQYAAAVHQQNQPLESEDDKPDDNPHIGSHFAEKNLSNKTHQSSTDKDAKISYKPGKPRWLNYLAQVSVDAANHVITYIQADYANKKDSDCLPQILKQLKGGLQKNGLSIAEIIADGNYSSVNVLKALEAQNISDYIPNFGGHKNNRAGFSYHAEGNYYQCSQGKMLAYKKTAKTKGRGYYHEYRSNTKDCQHCELRSKCIGKSAQKQIRDSVDKHYFDKMHQNVNSRYGRYLKKVRQSTVEPVLGSLIEYGGLKKIRTKGIQQANKCMTLAATAYNLKKWLKYTKNNLETPAMAQKIPQSISNYLFSLIMPFLTKKIKPHYGLST